MLTHINLTTTLERWILLSLFILRLKILAQKGLVTCLRSQLICKGQVPSHPGSRVHTPVRLVPWAWALLPLRCRASVLFKVEGVRFRMEAHFKIENEKSRREEPCKWSLFPLISLGIHSLTKPVGIMEDAFFLLKGTDISGLLTVSGCVIRQWALEWRVVCLLFQTTGASIWWKQHITYFLFILQCKSTHRMYFHKVWSKTLLIKLQRTLFTSESQVFFPCCSILNEC